MERISKKKAKIDRYRTCGNVGLNLFKENEISIDYESLLKANNGLSHALFEAKRVLEILESDASDLELLKKYNLQKYDPQRYRDFIAKYAKTQLELLKNHPELSVVSPNEL